MTKWNKDTFIDSAKDICEIRISNVIVELIKFSELNADGLTWGRGEGYGTMTYKCKSYDYGLIPLFHLTTNGQIKFPLNLLKSKISKKEIINDYQLKLESNFMMDFDEHEYPVDIYYTLDELFVMHVEIEKFINMIQSVSARLRQ